MLYSSGVFDDAVGCGTAIDHGMLMIGWGEESDGTFYWLLRNSWGTSWGESGYMKMANTSGAGMCGIYTDYFMAP